MRAANPRLAFLALVLALTLPASAASPASGAPALPSMSPDAQAARLAELGASGLPAIGARAAFVMDAGTGTLLYAKNPDLPIPPASLTKLVTLHVVYNEIAAGRLRKDELVTIDPRDCSPSIPYGSSLMYLRPGMRVSVLDLMRGAAVVSGNDAAYALARRVAGSNEAFALLMNKAVKDLGLNGMRFVEPSGLSELNTITAREYAYFCKRYMDLHPEAIEELHSLRFIEFPRAEHATADYTPKGRIVQYNRNALVLNFEGCDGLKTGYIIESGYNLAATAKRGGSRFLLVTLGGPESGEYGGGAARRSRDGTNLLTWCFANYVTADPKLGELGPVKTWYGTAPALKVRNTAALEVTVPKALESAVRARVDLPKTLDAPIAAGTKVGEVVYSVGDKVLRRVDLVAAQDLPKGNLFIVVRDALAKFFSRIFG